jgi:hypothetical protein
MPSVSERQAHLMAAVAHGWEPPGHHIDVGVATEFHEADKKVGKWEHTVLHPSHNHQSSDHMNKYG